MPRLPRILQGRIAVAEGRSGPRLPHIFYGWVVVAVAFFAALTTSGVRSAPVLFIVPFEEEFGWSRAAIAGAIALNLLLFGLGAPISGRLIDRFGPRAVMTGNLVILAVGLFWYLRNLSRFLRLPTSRK